MHQLSMSVKYKGKYYRRGDNIKLDKRDLNDFVSRGYVEKPYGHEVNTRKEEPVKKQEKPKKTDSEYSNLTIEELKIILDNKGIEYTSSDKKADLISKLEK